MHEDVPVERRTYYPAPHPGPTESEPCPVCGRHTFTPWTLRRDRERRVWRRWVCLSCQASQERPEDESA